MTRTLTALALVFAVSAGVARAQQRQQQVDPEAERQAEFSRLFAEGLDAITRRDLARSEALFKRCVELFPNQAVSHYNLACTYALGEKAEKAVAALRDAFRLGFVDLGHMSRDVDLDPIRRTPLFRGAISEFEAALLGQVGEPLTHVPAGDGPPDGLLVWVHDQRASPARDLERLRTLLPRWAILVPQGVPLRDAFAWDERVEFVVVERLRAFTGQLRRPGATPLRALVAGEGAAGTMALSVALHHPDLVAGVLAAGPNLGAAVDADLAPSGTRAYLLVHRDDANHVRAGVQARDRFVKAKSPVVLERYPLPNPLSQDRAVLLRALGWLQGREVTLPGAGAEHTF
ncbi:MAG: hypothetical protein M9894_04040 [Planctomycetes bacterium]|nr:hypothetical protein [Planctomycetota bacterium]